MTVTVYRSTDASAPTLYGAVSGLINVLDGCLVNGYGSQASLGWTKDYSGTNLAVYRPPSGNRFYLRVDDTGTSNARVVGYESMSAVSTGTNAFPTASQFSGGLYWLKSTLTDTTARSWILIGTPTLFYLFMNSAGAGAGAQWATNIYSFGDFTSFKPSDSYGTRITGNINTTNSATNNKGIFAFAAAGGTSGSTKFSGQYIARPWNGIGGSINVGIAVNSLILGVAGTAVNPIVMGGATDSGGNALTHFSALYPNGPDGQLMLARPYITEDDRWYRGYMPGIWVPGVGIGTLPDFGATISGSGDLANKTFEFITITNGSNIGKICIETSDTW